MTSVSGNDDLTVTLVSADNKRVVVKKSLLKPSTTLTDLMDDLDFDNSSTDIPIPNASGHILRMIVELLTHHKDHYAAMKLQKDAFLEKNPGETPKAYDHKRDMDQWNDEYLNKNLCYVDPKKHTDFVFEFILAVNFLSIEYLIYVGTRLQALRIKTCGQSRKALNNMFGIDQMAEPDITLEEEETLRKNEPWCAIGADQVLPRNS